MCADPQARAQRRPAVQVRGVRARLPPVERPQVPQGVHTLQPGQSLPILTDFKKEGAHVSPTATSALYYCLGNDVYTNR